MATYRPRPQLGKSRGRGLSWTFESRHWSAGKKLHFEWLLERGDWHGTSTIASTRTGLSYRDIWLLTSKAYHCLADQYHDMLTLRPLLSPLNRSVKWCFIVRILLASLKGDVTRTLVQKLCYISCLVLIRVKLVAGTCCYDIYATVVYQQTTMNCYHVPELLNLTPPGSLQTLTSWP